MKFGSGQGEHESWIMFLTQRRQEPISTDYADFRRLGQTPKYIFDRINMMYRICSTPLGSENWVGGLHTPGLHPGLFGLDSFGVQWIPAAPGGILFTSEDACAPSKK
jgi:hypothetical protein